MNSGEQRSTLEIWWKRVSGFLAFLNLLIALVLQVRGWLQDMLVLRYISAVPFFVFLVSVFWFGLQASVNRKRVNLWISLFILCIGSLGYGILVGTWIEPRRPGCADYDIHIIRPSDGAIVHTNIVEVVGSYRGNLVADNLVVIVTLPDSLESWPSSTPVHVDPILKRWKGVASLGGEPPQSYHIAIAFVGPSGRVLIEYYNKVGRVTGQWPSIEMFPDDVEICDVVAVDRR
ncbi:MAG: hypothetical protein RML46_06365 [Anaerolineae bacterium]|nr:hypothetical protein [Anaerolineae bacterium]MDW8068517.1 hypothetical protein [Anaerolineae bacterium]